MRCAPPSRGGRGYAVCDRSGMLVPAEDRVFDHRAGSVRPRSADVTAGFGTMHPRDEIDLPDGPDPMPIEDARPVPVIEPTGTIHDAELERRLREGR